MKIATSLAAATAWVLAMAAAGGSEPANPHATRNARKVLTYLYALPQRSQNRILSGHLAGGALGPNVPGGEDPYRFTLREIDHLHRLSGQWVGLIGADYCAGWIETPNPLEDTMYYQDLNQGLIEYEYWDVQRSPCGQPRGTRLAQRPAEAGIALNVLLPCTWRRGGQKVPPSSRKAKCGP